MLPFNIFGIPASSLVWVIVWEKLNSVIRQSYDLNLIGNLSLPPFLYYVDFSQSRPILLYGISKVRISPAGRLWWPKNALVGSWLVTSYVIYRYSPSCYYLGNRSLLSSGHVLFASANSSRKPQAMVYFWPLSLKAAARSSLQQIKVPRQRA